MTNLTDLTIAELKDKLGNKEVSSREVTEAYIKRIEEHASLNTYITTNFDGALEAADLSDKKYAAGDAGLLEGVPLGIKDLFCTKGIKTTAASKILGDFVPGYESTVSQNLKNDGAIFLGKTNLDEFAMGSSNKTSAFGNVVNPWKANDSDADLTPGGSSGGSSAAVAARLCAGATGTDTGGSIRQPASLTGTVGIKPTYGLCSRFGTVAFASSLDQAGPMTRTVTDAALMLESMAGHDVKDATSAKVEIPNYSKLITGDVKGLRVGIPKEYRVDGMPSEIDALWEKGAAWLKERGAEIVEVSLPHTKYALPTYYVLAPAEASSNLARYDGVRYGSRVESDDLNDMYEKTRGEGFGGEVIRRILVGTYVLSAGYYDAYYRQAQRVRRLIANDFDAVFNDVDVLLTPTTPGTAFPLDDAPKDPVTMYLNDVFTVTVNLAGLPGISVPAGLSENGLPLGLQLIGNKFDETRLLNAAFAVEQDAGFTAKPEGF